MCSATLMVYFNIDHVCWGRRRSHRQVLAKGDRIIGSCDHAAICRAQHCVSRNESSCAACLILSGEIKPSLAMKGIHDFEPGDIKIVLSRHRLDLDATTSMRQICDCLPAGRTLA
jgi:hypothetical protein